MANISSLLQKVNAAGSCGVDNSNREASSGTTETAVGGNMLPWNTGPGE